MMNNHKQRHLEQKSQQLLSDDILRGKTHKIDCKDIKCHSAILYARPVNQHSIMSLGIDQTEEESAVAFDTIRHAVMIATLSEIHLRFSGEWIVEVKSMSQATTLFLSSTIRRNARKPAVRVSRGRKTLCCLPHLIWY